ncbi:MAG TPA: hydantoinase B/oxoprolinase family protein [Capillimicrobium sp.]|nr:hydantoinase B/oxoprolinase family protein [Capillimicrobium sp.]
MSATSDKTLDPVTFEVLRNAFTTIVDEMAEHILRTCHSFVIFNRDISNALCDRDGNTVAQGTFDLAAQGGTLHFKCKAVIQEFGDDMHEGDVFIVNDPYAGGSHFSDVSLVRPIFVDDELIGFAQSSGHWADVGGKVPGSFDCTAREHFGEGVRMTPTRVIDRGVPRRDVIRMLTANMRAPSEAEGDLFAQANGTGVAEREVKRLAARYGKDTLLLAFDEVQDHVERFFRRRLTELPDGSWETTDYLDRDPGGEEGLIPIRVKMTIEGDRVHYDLHGSHPTVQSLVNSAFGGTESAIFTATKIFFPDVPLNSGFHRPISIDLPPDSVVDARWPVAVTGFVMTYDKVISSVLELWAEVLPERAIAACFNVEYLEIGGYDARGDERTFFMWYDWLCGGWGARTTKDGVGGLSPIFATGLTSQSVEGQERLSPVLTTDCQFVTDSGGPGRFRGGLGVGKGGLMQGTDHAVASYVCDRERSVTWGMRGGLPSTPNTMRFGEGTGREGLVGVFVSDVHIASGDRFWRASSGGGGYGDPLQRPPGEVLEDVLDDYVSEAGARRDYGVVIRDGEVDEAATERERAMIRASRAGWLAEDAEAIAARYRAGELDVLDLVRRYGVIVDWGTGELLARTTQDFRDMLKRRAQAWWTQDEVE